MRPSFKIRLTAALFILYLIIVPANAAETSLFGIGVHLQDHANPDHGVVVVGLDPYSPASMQLQVGHTITHINGEVATDPEIFAILVNFHVEQYGPGSAITLRVHDGIGKIYFPPVYQELQIPVAYHGGTYDYKKYDRPLAALLAGILDGATYKFGAEAFCVIEYVFAGAANGSVNTASWFNACVDLANSTIDVWKLSNGNAYRLGEMTGGVFFSIRDAMGKSAGKILGSKKLKQCYDNFTGELMDGAIWLQREGVINSELWMMDRNASKQQIIDELKSSGQFALGAGALQCILR